MKRSRILSVLSLSAILLFVGACSDDDNPANTPTLGTVSGRITFVGNWPAIGNIQVSLLDAWPPPPRAPYQASPVITANSVTYDYTFDGIERGTYPAIVVGWRDPANPAGAKVLGIYVNDATKTGINTTNVPPTYDTPVSIAISDAKMIWPGLDIRADLSLAQ